MRRRVGCISLGEGQAFVRASRQTTQQVNQAAAGAWRHGRAIEDDFLDLAEPCARDYGICPTSIEAVHILGASTQVAIERPFKVGLVAGELDHTVGIALEVRRRVEAVIKEHVPARLIAPGALAAVERMLDRAVHEAELAIDFRRRAMSSGRDGVAIVGRHAARQRGLVVTDHAQRHVMVARAHAAEVEEAPDPIERLLLPRPSVTGVGIFVPAAVEGLELRRCRHDGLAGVIEAGEAPVRLDVFVVRAQVIGDVPWLDHRIEVERCQRVP